MPKIAIEAVILAPLLVIQVFIFPLAAHNMTMQWEGARREVTLQEAANHLGTTIQQLYLSINQTEISAGKVALSSSLPETIEQYPYMSTGTLKIPSNPESGRTLTISMFLQGFGTTANTVVVLGSNVLWDETSVFYSNSPDASINVQKFVNGTLLFSFG